MLLFIQKVWIFFFADTKTFLETWNSEYICLKNVHPNRCLIELKTLQQKEIHTDTKELADFLGLVGSKIRKKSLLC